MKRTIKFWRDYPELIKKYRTPEEDKISNDIVSVLKKLSKLIEDTGELGIRTDLIAGAHLLQGVLITIQKRRYNKKRLGGER